jgi:hypothetical protein
MILVAWLRFTDAELWRLPSNRLFFPRKSAIMPCTSNRIAMFMIKAPALGECVSARHPIRDPNVSLGMRILAKALSQKPGDLNDLSRFLSCEHRLTPLLNQDLPSLLSSIVYSHLRPLPFKGERNRPAARPRLPKSHLPFPSIDARPRCRLPLQPLPLRPLHVHLRRSRSPSHCNRPLDSTEPRPTLSSPTSHIPVRM